MEVAWLLTNINASKILLGVAALAFNFGSRFLMADMTPVQQRMMQHPMFKRAIVFCMFFITTRDFLLSTTLALVTIVAMEAFLNEGSKFCIMPGAMCTVSKLPAFANMPALPSAVVRLVAPSSKTRRKKETAADKENKTEVVDTFEPLEETNMKNMNDGI
jgi:hypothetical protein